MNVGRGSGRGSGRGRGRGMTYSSDSEKLGRLCEVDQVDSLDRKNLRE